MTTGVWLIGYPSLAGDAARKGPGFAVLNAAVAAAVAAAAEAAAADDPVAGAAGVPFFRLEDRWLDACERGGAARLPGRGRLT